MCKHVVAIWATVPLSPRAPQIAVNNFCSEETTIHWHGIEQPGTLDQDGVSGVTQWNIPPGGNSEYCFTPPESGQYWYHSHL